MIKNYFKIALRNLWRNKGFSAINIFGLAIGIATCLLIMIFVQNELSYDRFNKKADRIVRVIFRGRMQGGDLKEASVMAPVAQTLKHDFPEVLEATRIRTYGSPRITYGEKMFRDDKFAFVDSNFFQVFTIPLTRGDAKTALLKPNSMVISRSVAQKYFGSADPIGKVLVFKDNGALLTVTGEIDEVPVNSHFHFGFFASMASLPEAREESWMTSNFHTYLVLPEGHDYKKLEAKLPQTIDKYMAPQLQKGMGLSMSEFRQAGNSVGLFLQPLTDIHLRSDVSGAIEPSGDIQVVYIFGAVALFMLVIACINFMNLSTGGASKRAKEVGIRKVMGSLNAQLVRQFLVESLMITSVALFFAVCLVYIALPFFNNLAGIDLKFDLRSNPFALLALVLLGLFTGLMAGIYPAFYLASFNPIAVLKGRFKSGKGSIAFRSGLVVFQFFISISLIIGTIVVYTQLAYIQHKNMGYDKDQVLIVHETFWLGSNQGVFRQQLLQDPHILSVSSSGYLPAGPTNSNNYFAYPDNNSNQLVKALQYEVDDSYIPTLGIQLASGRNFSKVFGSDSSGVIVNETAARAFGWSQDALGHIITHTNNDGSRNSFRVIGVVKDFHFKSLHELITPLVMTLGHDNGTMIAKVRTSEMPALLEVVKNKWNSLRPDAPFSFSFLDERVSNTYKSEQHIGSILGIFAALTIFVASLGLFGLATFTAEQRTKEIGIRKVLGANVGGLVSLLSTNFIRNILIAFVIALPVAWIVMNKWLQDFAYRITISWWMFVIAGLLAVMIALVTISFRVIRVALANPVKSLRTE